MKINFCSLALVGAACVGAGLVVPAATGQSGGDFVEAHIEAAKTSGRVRLPAGLQWFCGSLTPPPARAAAREPAPAAPAPTAEAHRIRRRPVACEPVKVFDNLYFLGQTEYRPGR